MLGKIGGMCYRDRILYLCECICSVSVRIFSNFCMSIGCMSIRITLIVVIIVRRVRNCCCCDSLIVAVAVAYWRFFSCSCDDSCCCCWYECYLLAVAAVAALISFMRLPHGREF